MLNGHQGRQGVHQQVYYCWETLVENTDLVLILCANMMCYDARVCERGDDILSRETPNATIPIGLQYKNYVN